MEKRQTRRLTGERTPEEQQQLDVYREQIARELPDLVARDQMRKDAREEPTLSGELLRAIHASELPLSRIAAQVGIAPLQLDEFLTGEVALASNVVDQLAALLGYELSRVR